MRCQPRSLLRVEHFTQDIVLRGGKRPQHCANGRWLEVAQGWTLGYRGQLPDGLLRIGDEQFALAPELAHEVRQVFLRFAQRYRLHEMIML